MLKPGVVFPTDKREVEILRKPVQAVEDAQGGSPVEGDVVMDHPRNLATLVARAAQKLLHTKRIDDGLEFLVANVHIELDSCLLRNYQARELHSEQVQLVAGVVPYTGTAMVPLC